LAADGIELLSIDFLYCQAQKAVTNIF